jgi:hypothetical protein
MFEKKINQLTHPSEKLKGLIKNHENAGDSK